MSIQVSRGTPVGIEGVIRNAPGMCGTLGPQEINAVSALGGTNRVYMGRVVIPKSGILHNLSIDIGTSSGNVDVAIYDLGDTTPGTYTRLNSKGGVACPTGSAWQIIYDPAMPVIAGQQFAFAVGCDNTTATFGNKGVGTMPVLPTGFPLSPGGNLFKAAGVWTAGGTYICPSFITEANLVVTNMIFSVLGYIV